MRKIYLLCFLLLAISLGASPTYYPITSLAEGFFASWCVTCHDGLAGIQIVDDSAHNGELVNLRYYTASGDLSNPTVDQRILHYEVFGVPVMIFNGKVRLDGGGANVANGNTYMNAYKHFRYGSSPIKMSITNWQASTGTLNGTIQMISPTTELADDRLFFLLVEDNVSAEATRVVRDIATGNVNLTGAGNSVTFDHQFTINPAWNVANLWVAAFVQLADNSILQTASSLPIPEHNFRIAMNWDADTLVTPANSTYNSPTMWFYNLGISDNYTMEIVVDDAPANWWFNYCDEEGTCLPGSAQIPISLAAGEYKGFHLNIIVGDTGIAHFRYRIISPGLGTYDLPFTLRTSDYVSNEDYLNPTPDLSLISNYPNPFTGQTNIRLEAVKEGNEQWIDIFNSKGQLVDNIRIPAYREGAFDLTWTAPATLSSGLYLYKLRGSQAQPGKMLLIR